MTVTRRARDAITGRFRSLAYALAHPKTTVVEIVRKVKR